MVDSTGVPIRTKLSVPYLITAILFKSSNYDFWFSLDLREFMLRRWSFCLALAELFEVLLMAAAPRVVLLLFIIGLWLCFLSLCLLHTLE